MASETPEKNLVRLLYSGPRLICFTASKSTAHRLRFGVAIDVQTEPEGADHLGGISLGGTWPCSKCAAEHQREQAERHPVPESEERHFVSLSKPPPPAFVQKGRDRCESLEMNNMHQGVNSF